MRMLALRETITLSQQVNSRPSLRFELRNKARSIGCGAGEAILRRDIG